MAQSHERIGHEGELTAAWERELDTTLWIALGIAVAVGAGYLLVMRVFFRESKEAVERIDYSKVREWKDDDE